MKHFHRYRGNIVIMNTFSHDNRVVKISYYIMIGKTLVNNADLGDPQN